MENLPPVNLETEVNCDTITIRSILSNHFSRQVNRGSSKGHSHKMIFFVYISINISLTLLMCAINFQNYIIPF